MKKLYTTLVAIFAVTQFSYGQNTSWSTSGSIGIGTTNPGAKLHLVEDASTTGATALKLTNRNSNQTWGLAVDVDAVDDKKFMIYDVTGSKPWFTINTSGNVGIGTTSPISGLDVTNVLFIFLGAMQ
ncbi:MAG: hypothetical protein JWQ34_316 [Mucilaginibacter sp.]|uniref:hypothetical protein n=1 Tax=Mucilaginibacter sp. TaxID=1882438 RepID=UPI002622C4F4|nr:hypothetical protein [Mucilaginibacter sp.]MDB5002091.1 hypothetical protein [Mucilaginibacter sp.]